MPRLGGPGTGGTGSESWYLWGTKTTAYPLSGAAGPRWNHWPW